MEYTLKELLDIPRLRQLLDALDEIHSMPSAIIDIEGNILTATAWQDICTKFHRINPETEKKCIESDTHIGAELDKRMPHVIYHCPMGLVDAATPIIIGGKHLGNVFTGQLFMEPPDEDYFIKQARQYGFDENEYLEAMRKVPFFPEEKLHKNLTFIHSLTQMLAEQGLQFMRLREAEKALRLSDDHHRSILSTAMDGIWLVDSQGRFLEVNEAFCQMSGYSKQELLTMCISDVEANERPEDTANSIHNIILQGHTRFLSRHRRKNGTVYDVEVSTQLQSDEGGRFVVFLRDITEKLRAERAVLESEKQYRQLFQNQPTGFALHEIIVDSEGKPFDYRFLEVNPAFEKLTGLKTSDLIGKTQLEVMPNSEPYWAEKYGNVALTGTTISFDNYSGVLNKHYQVIAYSPEPGKFATVFMDVTDLKQAEAALLNVRRMHEEAERIGKVGGWEFDTETFEQTWTDEVYRIHEVDLSYKPSVADGINFYTPASRSVVEQAVQRAIEHGEPFDLNLEIITAKGNTKAVHVIGRSDREKHRVFGFFQDTTEHKKAEEEITRLTLRQRAILDNLPMMAWLKDTESRLEMINEPYAKACGRSVNECIGKTDQELFPCEMAKGYMDDDHQVCLSGQKKYVEEAIATPEGVKWHHTFKTPIFDEQGNVTGTTGIAQDITDRKQIEMALVATNQLLQTIIDTVPMRIFWKDTELHYLGCNRNFAHDAGVSQPSDLIGKDDFQFVWKAEAELYQADDRHVIDSGVSKISFEEPQTTPDGNQIWLRTSKVPLHNEKDEIIGVLGVYEDITQWKRAEEEKLLFEQQLQHTQKLESLGVLSGGIAHDFNNILAIIMGYCSLTKMDYETTEQNIQEIEKATERAAALCRQMLTYAGKAQLSMTQVNMWMLVDEMVKMLKATLPQNAVIRPDLSPNIPYVFADSSQLRQIVMNLIINASEAIGKEQGEIRVSLTRTTITGGQIEKDYHGKEIPAGEYVCMEVTDTGCGMNEETKWRIFEPFYTTKFTGRGLGMSAVLGIINSHNGALQLFSQLGQGTTFKVYLPLPKSVSLGDGNQIESAPSISWRGSGTILLVEDEEQIRYMARIFLENFGFTVLEAENGKEALELYQKYASEIRLVLTDMGMPVMDGYALFPALKQLNHKLPIIISSGFGDADVASRLGLDNIAGIISKPYNPNQLWEVLKRVVEGIQSAHA